MEKQVLLDNDTGILELLPGAEARFNPLDAPILEQMNLRQEFIQLFGKKVAQPRLSRFYADPGVEYVYSQTRFTGVGYIPFIEKLKRRMEELTSGKFNSALVNFYRNGHDSMGLHADDERELGENPIIASVSYGETRLFRFVRNGFREKVGLNLEHGDVVVMRGALQHHWKHELPKQRKVESPRMNITFRLIYPK